MRDPLVSVHMLAYNHGPYVSRAIEAVLAQKTNFPFELVIGEDCSTDGTREIVFAYRKKYPDIIRVITSDTNCGVVGNVYRTEKACRGKYIAFCEGDDYWHRPDKLQLQIDFLESHPGYAMVFSDYDIYYVNRKKRIRNVNRTAGRDPLQNLSLSSIIRGESGIHTCTVCVRREILWQVVESDPLLFQSNQFSPFGDVPRWSGVFNLAPIGYLDESLGTYSRISESATRGKSVIRILRTRIVNKQLMMYLTKKYNLPDSEYRAHERDLQRRRLRLAFFEGDVSAAREIRQAIPDFNWLEWMEYLGACHPFLHFLMKPFFYLAPASVRHILKIH